MLARDKRKRSGSRGGQTVDVSIMERLEDVNYLMINRPSIEIVHLSMLNLMEGIVPEYSRKGVIRGPSGSSVTGIVPTNAYPTAESSSYVIIGANGDSIYERLMDAIDRPDLIGPAYAHNQERVARQTEIEDAISAWTKARSPEEVCRVMDEARVPVGRIMNVKDIMSNEHVTARGMIERIHVPSRGATSEGEDGADGWDLEVSRVAPRLEQEAPTRWAGPDLGHHTQEVLAEVLNFSSRKLNELRSNGIIN